MVVVTKKAGTFEISAQPEDWAKVLVSDKDWEKSPLILNSCPSKGGIDFSNAPPETIFVGGIITLFM